MISHSVHYGEQESVSVFFFYFNAKMSLDILPWYVMTVLYSVFSI